MINYTGFKQAAFDYLELLNKNYAPDKTLPLISERYSLTSHEETLLRHGITDSKRARIRRTKKTTSILNKYIVIDLDNILNNIILYLAGKSFFTGNDTFIKSENFFKHNIKKDQHLPEAVQLLTDYILQNKPEFCEIIAGPDFSRISKYLKNIRQQLDKAEIKSRISIQKYPVKILKEKRSGIICTSNNEIIDNTECKVNDLSYSILKYEFGIYMTDMNQLFEHSGDYVIVIHGLLRTAASMNRIARKLSHQGYEVINMKYPSRPGSVEDVAENQLAEILEKKCTDTAKSIHFVTHSMGGIILRYYLKNHEIDNPGRVVMLSPPNHGSELADFLSRFRIINKIAGPALKELGTGDNSIINSLPEIPFEAGIITGDKPINPVSAKIITGANDGKVSVESSKLQMMKDFLVAHKSHSFIMFDDKITEQIINFLQHGFFL